MENRKQIQTHLKNKTGLLLILFTAIGAILHFYNLNWGSPWYFHPDERNIASSVSQLQFPNQMNPHFFAYGSLPIYAIYFAGLFLNIATQFFQFLFTSPLSQAAQFRLQPPTVGFSQAIVISRFFSAVYATFLIPVLFILGKNLTSAMGSSGKLSAGLLAAFFTTTSVGFIQFAHFGTFEMWLTFWSVSLLWLSAETLQRDSDYNPILIGITFGILIATKVSNIALLPLPLLALCVKYCRGINYMHISTLSSLRHFFNGMRRSNLLSQFSAFLGDSLIIITIALSVYFVTNPYVLLDYSSFSSSMNYESSVALGSLLVFYSGEFYSTIPIIFQSLHVFPFLLNPLLTILFIPCLLFICYQMIKKRNPYLLLLTTCFLLLLLSQAFFYVKWTRYMVPTLPFIYVIIAMGIRSVMSSISTTSILRLLSRGTRGILLTISLLTIVSIPIVFSLSYFITAFVEPDVRSEAVQFAQKYIPASTPILSEVYDLGITPFNPNFHNIILFNFYDLDNHSPDVTPEALHIKLLQSDYVILPSQRILKIRLTKPTRYPNGYAFYRSLTNGGLGFKKMYETPCDIFCRITYLGDPVYTYEETVNVFDRPEVYIFKKI